MTVSQSARTELKRRLVNIVRFLDRECSDAWQREQLLAECDQIASMLRPSGPPRSRPVVQSQAA